MTTQFTVNILSSTIMEKIIIRFKECHKIDGMGVSKLKKVVDSGIVQIELGQELKMPITHVEGYLFLRKNLELQRRGLINDQYVVGVIDQIITDPCAIRRKQDGTQIDEVFLPLQTEIIEVVSQLYPHICRRYQLESKIMTKMDKEKVKIQFKNSYGVRNYINLCLRYLTNSQTLKLTPDTILNILESAIIPFYLQIDPKTSTDICQNISQTLKMLMITFRMQKIQQKISILFCQHYKQFWLDCEPNHCSSYDVGLLEKHFTLLELIHFNIPYHEGLTNSGVLSAHLKVLLLFRGQNKATVHYLGIGVYQKLAKQLNHSNTTTKTFSNLFNILSSYGVHLIRDVWPSFYSLIETRQSSVFDSLQLLQLILLKLQYHQNTNVIKFCLHDLIQHPQSNRIFENYPQIVYKTIIRLLNLGVHYLDCQYHMDSKIYPKIAQFFLKFYQQQDLPLKTLEQHLSWFLESMLALENYDQAIIALLMVFIHLKRQSTFLSSPLLDKLTILLQQGYGRYPIRKRYQILDSIVSLLSFHLNTEQINIHNLLSFITLINKEYLIEENVYKIIKIFDKYGKNEVQQWIYEESQEIIIQVKMNINHEKDDYDPKHLLKRIKMVQLCAQLFTLSLTDFQIFFKEIIVEYGQSQYKTAKQRHFVLSAYGLLHNWILPHLNSKNHFSQHLEAILNLIAMFSTMKFTQNTKHFKLDQDLINTISIFSYQLFLKSYTFNKGDHFSLREEERVVIARMIEWAYDSIQETLAFNIILNALRARVTVLRHKIKNREQSVGDKNLFEETLYQIYNNVTQLQQQNWKTQNQLSFLPKNKQLRLKLLLTTVLIHDPTHKLTKNRPQCDQIGDIIDRYDYQRYEEVCWMIQAIYCQIDENNQDDKQRYYSEEGTRALLGQLELLLENMMHSLEYNIEKKQIYPICQLAVNLLFSFALSASKIHSNLVDFCLKLLQMGQSYLIFQRTIALTFTQSFITLFPKLINNKCDELIPIIISILSIQEYRGFDSAIYCSQQNKQIPIYQLYKAELQNNYLGAVPRFTFIRAFKQFIIDRAHKNKETLSFLDNLIHQCLEIGLSVGKQRMFLSGKNKVKLKMWQFLLSFQPQTVLQCLGNNKFHFLLIKLIEALNLNIISQIRYYYELFLMKLLLNPNLFQHINKQVLITLKQGVVTSSGNVIKCVAYMIISGITVRHISSMSQSHHQHFKSIKSYFIDLFNALLTYVGSSVAYFRGLSQYICLSDTFGSLQTKYVSILRQNYMIDADATILRENIVQIIQGYLQEIHSWRIKEDILNKLPNENLNVVSHNYYLDKLKVVGTDLAKMSKNQDGYTAYRNIWKKNAAKGQPQIEHQDQQEEKVELQKIQSIEQQGHVFQRKIDMTMDLINTNQSNSHLKIMITSARSQALIGHLARTGQIFGIQELIIPDIKTISMDSFKSISVTAQRWVKISQLGGHLDKNQLTKNISKFLIKNKSNGYQILKLTKNTFRTQKVTICPPINKKCILILDQSQILSDDNHRLLDGQFQLSKFFSLHVEASIVIWQYFKKYLNQ